MPNTRYVLIRFIDLRWLIPTRERGLTLARADSHPNTYDPGQAIW